MQLEVNHTPIALILQIGPDGKLIEPVLRCEMTYSGGTHPRDIWIKDPPAKWRLKANQLIEEALKVIE